MILPVADWAKQSWCCIDTSVPLSHGRRQRLTKQTPEPKREDQMLGNYERQASVFKRQDELQGCTATRDDSLGQKKGLSEAAKARRVFSSHRDYPHGPDSTDSSTQTHRTQSLDVMQQHPATLKGDSREVLAVHERRKRIRKSQMS